jgi:RHS repeat-associated protein
LYLTNLNQYTGVVGAAAIYNEVNHQIGWYAGWSYSYLNDEHLKWVQDYYATKTYDLSYDALGRCVKRTLNGVTTYYVYDGEKPVLEYNTSGGIVGRNLYGKAIDEILMRVDVTNNWTLYYQQDHEGSVTHLTGTAGTVIEKYRYDAFGAPTIYDPVNVIPATAWNNRFLFTGREYRSTFGFYEYRARAYHPGLGRFMSEDPKLFDAGDYNLFRYCHNDPLDLTDPMGLETNWAGAGPQNPQNHAAIARLAEIRNLRELTGAGGAISTGTLNYAIGKLSQALASIRQPSNNIKVLSKRTVHERADNQLRQGEAAKTEAVLHKPLAFSGPGDALYVRQPLQIDVYFSKGASSEQRAKEYSNVLSLEGWAEMDVPAIVAPLKNVHFSSFHAAETAVDDLVRPKYNTMYGLLKMKDSPLGENIEVQH